MFINNKEENEVRFFCFACHRRHTVNLLIYIDKNISALLYIVDVPSAGFF